MTRVALISDQHFDTTSRWQETRRIAAWIVDDLRTRGVDVICLGGDLFERRPLPEETAAVAEWLVELATVAPVVGVYGNHDVPHSLEVMNRLRSTYPIRIYETPSVHVVAGAAGAAVACLPWPRKGALLAQLDASVAREAANDIAVEHLRNILRGLGDALDRVPGPRLFLGHVMLRAARVSTGQPLCGQDFELGVGDLGLVRAQAYLLGHVHCGQQVEIDGAPCLYPGSFRRTAFGEVEDKTYALVTIDGERVEVENVVTPATPMLLLEGEYVGTDGASFVDAIAFHGDAALSTVGAGAEVRVRFLVAADERDAGRRAAAKLRDELLARGAAHVKIEEQVVATVKARAPEIAAAKTLAEKLSALWKVRGDELAEERRARLLAKVSGLEEVADAA